jgi:hypothetical protein
LTPQKSTYGYVYILSFKVASWTKKKFNFLPEIEYMAYTLATKKAIWLGQLLFDLGKKNKLNL